ncbi:ABC transporter substrate-binding protein [Paenibacillus sp. GYB003]|uniref:ABC transporter substrate-binding protein n=1 Tax=Paenibacillus sp. GYB003 TaxID=2994392 RepID=UPI002F961118
MNDKLIKTTCTVAVIAALAAGCSQGGGSSANEAKPEPGKPAAEAPLDMTQGSDEKAEIRIRTGMSEEAFEQRIRKVLKPKFPNVTFTRVGYDIKLQDLLASSPPDIIDQGITNLEEITDVDLPMNLDPLVQKHKVDLNRFDPYVIQDIRSYSVGKNELLMLPFVVQPFVLHYNKDLFDKFGVPYPKANSTWPDLIELSKKLARSEQGVAYRGLDAGLNVNRMQKQLSLPFIDAKTGKSLVGSTPGWKTLYQTYADIYGVPGNFPEGAKHGDGRKAFLESKTLAMYPHIVMLTDTDFVQAAQSGLKFGITTYPVFQDKPGVGTGLFGGGMAISKTTKHQELAFRIILYYTSDEAQKELGRMGFVTPLVSKEVRNALFEGNPLASGIDLNAIYGTRVADPYVRTKYDQKAFNIVNAGMQSFFTGQVDMNTALRDADEKIEKMVREEQNK